MKNFEIMAGSYFAAVVPDSMLLSCGSTFWPGIARNSPAIDDLVVRLQSAFDDAQIALQRTRSAPCAARRHSPH